ncbi:unannotated protein [freshwater metagenome]|uniref:Unannotated protein n=1 Tax=freshwater metagenome TaxID=449393 RepID=A0A6J6CV97_9ZZZZ
MHGPARIANDFLGPASELLLAEHVVEAHHAFGVCDGGECGIGLATPDDKRRTVLSLQNGELGLDFAESIEQRVVLSIADQRFVTCVVGVGRLKNALGYFSRFGLGFLEVGCIGHTCTASLPTALSVRSMVNWPSTRVPT